MDKRGFAITFKWIFALIAGFIIFLFLISFAYKHIYLSEKTTSAILLTSLETQLDSLSVADYLTQDSLDLNKEFLINFDCNFISSGEGNIKTEKIIFSNKQIKARELSLWTQKYKYPFDIASFFYITDGKTKYHLFDQPYDLFSNTPSSFQVSIFPDKVPEDAVLIFFRQPTTNELSQYKNHQIKIIKDNKITFYPNKITEYYGDEMLLGAIFTDDFSKFECLKQKALKKLQLVTFVYQKKAQVLAKFECADQYQNMINLLNDIKSNHETIDDFDKEIERNGCTPLFH